MKTANTTLLGRTSRTRRFCDSCHWLASLRGSPTIAPGHRYVRHVTFPGADGNESGRVQVNVECVACLGDREPHGGLLIAGACSTFCHGELPCALPERHAGDHSCRRCVEFR